MRAGRHAVSLTRVQSCPASRIRSVQVAATDAQVSPLAVRNLIEALDFVVANRKRFPLHDLVDGKYPLDRVGEAMADAAAGRVLRAAIVP